MLRTSGTKLLAAALTVVLAGVCLADGYLIHGRRPAAAPPAEPYHFLDDFETDSAAYWTEVGSWIGAVTINGGSSGQFVADAATGSEMV